MKNVFCFLLTLIFVSECLGQISKEQLAFRKKYSVKFVEVCSRNSTGLKDGKDRYCDWIEFFNYGSKGVNLSGCYITNDIDDPTRSKLEPILKDSFDFRIPARAYRTYWMKKDRNGGSRYLGFELNGQGDFLALFAPDGKTLIDSITIPFVPKDFSFGIDRLGSKPNFFSNPTPGYRNKKALPLCNKPIVPIKAGSFMGNSLKIEQDSVHKWFKVLPHGDTLVDDLDNHFIGSPTTFKIYGKHESCAGNDPVIRTYFKGKPHSLPVFYLTLDTLHTINKLSGLFAGLNYKRKMTKNGVLEYFGSDQIFRGIWDVTVKLNGAFSKSYPQKSITLSIDKDGTKENFRMKFFKHSKYKKYRSIVLRNSGNDWAGARMRDAFMSEVLRQSPLSLNVQLFEPVVFYLNGQYHGLYNMREKLGLEYIKNKYDVPKKKIEIVEKHHMVSKGEGTSFFEMMSFARENSFRKKSIIDSLSKIIDLNDFIEYYAFQIYVGNKDWPQNNVKQWREVGGKWKFLMYDLDEAFKYPELNSFELALGRDEKRLEKFDSVYSNSCLIYRKLMENLTYRKKFISQLYDQINFTFESEKMEFIVDSLMQKMGPEMSRTLQYWYPQYSGLSSFKDDRYYSNWIKSVNRLKIFSSKRNEFIATQLMNLNWIESLDEFTIDFDPSKYSVKVNGIPLEKSKKLIYPKNCLPLLWIESIAAVNSLEDLSLGSSFKKVKNGWRMIKSEDLFLP